MRATPEMKGRSRQGQKIGREGFKSLGRALRYLSHYRRAAVIAYATLFISSGAQLMVPWLVKKRM